LFKPWNEKIQVKDYVEKEKMDNFVSRMIKYID